jgi:16S rRNA processing protein RimM
MKISVAIVLKPRGFRGELAVIPYKPNSGSLKKGARVTLQKGENSREATILDVVLLNGRISLRLDDIESEEAAEYWRGAELLMESESLEKLGTGEYYHFQIEGCEVYEDSGKFVGKVKAVESYTANDILSLDSEQGEILIPMIKSVIESIDIESKKIIIRKLEGLY